MYRLRAKYCPALGPNEFGDEYRARGKWRVVDCWDAQISHHASIWFGTWTDRFGIKTKVLVSLSPRLLRIGQFCNPHKLLKESQGAAKGRVTK